MEIGFASAADQAVFNEAFPILFSDEQNMFAATIAYALPQGSRTLVDRIADPSPNGNDALDQLHVHFGPGAKDLKAFAAFMASFAETLAAERRPRLTDRALLLRAESKGSHPSGEPMIISG